jgi:hypothetical protein
MGVPVKARIGDLEAVERTCEQCGHPWEEHLMCSQAQPPTEGWIECPEEGCSCRSSWKLTVGDAAEMRKSHVAE